MKGEGLLKAATESIEAAQERMEREREADRRTMAAILRQLEDAMNRAWELAAIKREITEALSRQKTGRLLKTVTMARQVSIHPVTLREMAERGKVRGYQQDTYGHWLFDPDEVVADLKRGPTDLYGCDAERDRQIMEQIEQVGARDVESGV